MAVVTLRELREAKGLSARQVAEDLGIGVKTVYRHEAMDIMALPRLDRLGYSAYHGIPIDALEEAA